MTNPTDNVFTVKPLEKEAAEVVAQLREVNVDPLARRAANLIERLLPALEPVKGEARGDDTRKHGLTRDGVNNLVAGMTETLDAHGWECRCDCGFLCNRCVAIKGLAEKMAPAADAGVVGRLFYVIDSKRSQRMDQYLFWRPKNAGYTTVLEWAGRYSGADVLGDQRYYNNGDTIAVPCEIVDEAAKRTVTTERGLTEAFKAAALALAADAGNAREKKS